MLTVHQLAVFILASAGSSLAGRSRSSRDLADISKIVPPNQFDSLYPPYNYVPAEDGDYTPHPHGSAVTDGPWSFPSGFPFTGPHGDPNQLSTLPPLIPGTPYSYWYENIVHNGTSPFIANGSSWQVYRSVMEFGAKGDGHTDDTAAIVAAINAQDRGPGGNGKGTTGAPAVVYFPTGRYLISSTLPMYVDTVLMGNPISRPTLVASPTFQNDTMVMGFDPAFDAPTNFYMGVKNLIFDSHQVDPNIDFLLLDWGVSQATQLTNTRFRMPRGSMHTGISTVQGGSGTYMGDLEIDGGVVGLNFNNQQYNIKNVTFRHITTAILITHGFDIVFQGLEFQHCTVGINATSGGMGNIGSYALIDSTAHHVDTLIATKSQTDPTTNTTTGDDSVVIDNLAVYQVNQTVVAGSQTLLTGSVPDVWVYGNAYVANGPSTGQHDNGVTYKVPRDQSLVVNGQYFTTPPPTYEDYALDQVINIKGVEGFPVYGDGQTVSRVACPD